MTMTQTTQATWRKTKAGQWVVCGPTSVVVAGEWVTVAKRNGATSAELIERTGRSFDVAGVETVYGYPLPGAAEAISPRRPTRRTERCHKGHTAPQAGCRDCFDTFDF